MKNNHKKLSAKKLCKKYGDFWAVREADLEVNKGEIVGLLGPNGAGKTTTFYMITGMIKPTQGSIFLDESNITKKAMYQRSRYGIGYLPQDESIFRKRKILLDQSLKSIQEKFQGISRHLEDDHFQNSCSECEKSSSCSQPLLRRKQRKAQKRMSSFIHCCFTRSFEAL